MPVHTLPHEKRGLASFIVCDKRDDINRVAVPISRLEQWQASATSVADLIAGSLGLRRPEGSDTSATCWEVGMFKGAKRASHVLLLADGRLTLCLGGHSIALADILTFDGKDFRVDKRTLVPLVDKPIAGAGDAESAAQRRMRLKKWVQTEEDRGTTAFLKTVAKAEGISVPHLTWESAIAVPRNPVRMPV